ncbi:MAG: hypothetical protein ACLPTQ_19900 [Terriglobales bacterium]
MKQRKYKTSQPAIEIPPDVPILPRLLSVKQAACYLGIGVWALRELHWAHVVRGMTLGKGRRLLFDRTLLDAYVDRREVEAGAR